MKVFTCRDHKGHWPVGAASVVVAKDKKSARSMLKRKLESLKLGGESFTLQELNIHVAGVTVLRDGEY